jgi:uncharacterized protein YbjT (DUF2867 family)
VGASAADPRRVLVTGATGFVGRHLVRALVADGHLVLAASRHPPRAHAPRSRVRWVRLDVDDGRSVDEALQGARVAYYLVHALHARGDYAARELRAAERFARSAQRRGVARIVYLGGVAPSGPASRHLRSRLAVGEALRQGAVPVVELRAGMIVGAGSDSFRMVRDLCVRLPVLLLPDWLRHRSQPVAIDDAVVALRAAAALPAPSSVALDLPGPEVLSGADILCRTRRLLGLSTQGHAVAGVGPALAARGARWLTRVDPRLLRELLLGLQGDLLAVDQGIWNFVPGHVRLDFDTAARRALDDEARGLGLGARALEGALHRLWQRTGFATP